MARAWRLSSFLGDHVTPGPAQFGGDRHGSPVLADAIYQNLNIVADDHLDYILVLGADHIYRMTGVNAGSSYRDAGACHVGGGWSTCGRGRQLCGGRTRPKYRGQRVAAKPPDPVALADGRDERYASMGTTC